MEADPRDPMPDLERPALRQLEIQPGEHGGQRGLVIADPLRLQDLHFVPEGLLPLLALFDGQRTLDDIRSELSEATGQEVPAHFLEDIVQQLDEALLLHSPRFRRVLAKATDTFLNQPARPARHAGSVAYPADGAALGEALTAVVGSRAPCRPSPRGLIAPHIDLFRGREGYAQAYGYLAECEPADLYVVFGTGHQGPGAPVTGLGLDWETPLGIAATDSGFLRAVESVLGTPRHDDLFLHRDEHSIEFQTVFLQHLARRREVDARVVGFLCGQLPSASGDPMEEEYLQRIVAAFRRAESGFGGSVCYVAGADLAHVGPLFGDEAPVDTDRLERLERDDRERLVPLQEGRPGVFHRGVEATGNPDRVCGTTPMTLVAVLAGGGGELLHYGQAPADDGSQVVSFCSMVFPGA